MKKITSILMIAIFLLGLIGCSSSSNLQLTLSDGTVKNMSVKSLYSWQQEYEGRNFEEFENMMDGAVLSGEATIEKIEICEPDAFIYSSGEAIRFRVSVHLDNGVYIEFCLTCQNGYDRYVKNNYALDHRPDVDLYVNDKISFSGKNISIYENSVGIWLDDVEIGEKDEKISLTKIKGITLS